MKYKAYRNEYGMNGHNKKHFVCEGEVTEQGTNLPEEAQEVVVEVSPGVFIEFAMSEWGEVSLVDKPKGWD